MKITVYCDKEGILRYNPNGWPQKPETAIYFELLRIAKSESIPFEDQDTVLFLISESLPGILIDLLNLTKPDSFYEIEIIQLDHLIHQRGESYHSNPISAARIPKALS